MHRCCGSGRRLLIATLAASALWLLCSPSAFAQSLVSLPSSGEGSTDATVGLPHAVAPVVETTTAVVQETTPLVAQQAAAPVVASATPTAERAAQTVAPVVEVATPLLEPVLESAAPVLDAAAPSLAPLASGVLDVAAPSLGTTEPPPASSNGPITARSTTVSHSPTDVSSPTAAGEGAIATAARDERPLNRTGDPRSVNRRSQHAGPPLPEPARTSDPYSPVSADIPSSSPKGTRATAGPSRRPGMPGTPSVPGSVAAAVSGGAASIVLAALVVSLLLAAPELGRRLRLRLALWPPPVPLPSLERPG
jgi:hypothetical protein